MLCLFLPLPSDDDYGLDEDEEDEEDNDEEEPDDEDEVDEESDVVEVLSSSWRCLFNFGGLLDRLFNLLVFLDLLEGFFGRFRVFPLIFFREVAGAEPWTPSFGGKYANSVGG